MPYQINYTDQTNYGSITVADQSINEETSLQFVGKNYTGYAKIFGENFLHLLENFAKSTAPTNPVIGQLWYDTNTIANPPQPQLKVYDGTSWVAAGNVKKALSQPITSVIGDLWVDTANQQLYIWSGSTWILVGPQFSEGTQSGPTVEEIYDINNVQHVIFKNIVGGETVAIFSKDAFTPKVALDGFETIKQGLNLSTKDFDLDGSMLNKFWGTAEKADALVVGNNTVLASNFLRSDTASTTNYGLNVRNNAGLTIGSDLGASLSVTSNGAVLLYNRTEGANIVVRVNQSGTPQDVVTVSGTNVGINKNNPTEALDVSGRITVSNGLIVTATTDASDLTTGSIKTAGGVSITKSLFVGTGADITGVLTSNNIVPKLDSTYNLGSSTKAFNRIYSDVVGNEDSTTQFIGTFVGSFSGSVTGSASRLTSPTIFSITGDVNSVTPISFTGQQPGGVATFTTSLSTDFINTKTAAVDSLLTDEFIINRPSVGLRKITKSTIFSQIATVPAGAIFPYAGATAPDGYLFCDGSEVLIADYPELYAAIGYAYKAVGLILGVATFGLPDLRGRFALGADNMDNGLLVPLLPSGATTGTTITTPANRVTDVTADTIGLGNGDEEKTIDITNLPDHDHDLKGDAGSQFYALRNSTTPIADTDFISASGPTLTGTAQLLPNSGGVNAGTTDVPLNIMNPYLTINYIIFTGRINP